MRKMGMRAHGFLDFFIGLLLIISPAVWRLPPQAPEALTPIGVGIALLGYSLLTDYQFGVFRIISMPAHLLLDLATGIVLALSPWMFGFSTETWLLHLLGGVILIVISLLTNPRPVYHLIKYRKRKLHKPLYRTYSIR